MPWTRIILHVDMDSFFASIEIHEHPELAGKPVIVGADPKAGRGRGVVSTCSYEARKFGIHSGMPISQAYTHCPEAVYLPVNFKLYVRVSERIMHIMETYAGLFQQVSIDEAFLDLSDVGSYEHARQRAMSIKEEIQEKEGLTCSIGIGPNKLIAKIASGFSKPDGLTVVKPEQVSEFLSPLPVKKIPGIGSKTEKELEKMGISTIGDLYEFDIQILISRFGKWGLYLHELAAGVDTSEVRQDRIRKSISREITFEEDTDDRAELKRVLDLLAESVHRTLVENQFLFRTITVKVRYSGFVTHTKAHTLSQFSNDLGLLKKIAETLLSEFMDNRKIRLLGLRLSKFEQVDLRQKTLGEYLDSV